jgi:hypothetical protein
MSDIQLKITNTARKMVQSNPALNVKQLVDEAWRDRLLARVFSGASKANWLLKGGSSMLARVPNSRETRDIDLLNCKEDIETAKSELIELSHVDLDDGFLFVFQSQTEIGTGEMQPYLTGMNLKFDVYIGGQLKGKISIDLVTGHTLTGMPVIVLPVNCLNISGIKYVPYRLYPIEDQIADKICAMHETHNGFRSSRVKDLVDLLILALHCDIDGSLAVRAFELGYHLRNRRNRRSFFLRPFLPSCLRVQYPEMRLLRASQ